eukprot:TRINITY_DN11867_c1_g1_i10.p1 TRINITY_DN11867_c1_g1~~TRINITY_DN11867_c1_g1_i10.p1  ORF type:complete len:111 (+),score=22.78 TRINITY_DN11867_c1_g1_i10:227-559(+)
MAANQHDASMLPCIHGYMHAYMHAFSVHAHATSQPLILLSWQRMVHMDLAARNALVGEGNIIKVADFGLTRPYEEGKNHMYLREPMKLALKWISIEGMDKKLFSEKSDVW